MKLEFILPKVRGRFQEDGLEVHKGDWIIKCFGYISNINELCQSNGTSIDEIIVNLIETNENNLPLILKGAYLIYAENTKSSEILIYNDLLSKFSVFYTSVERLCIVSDSFLSLVNRIKKSGGSLTPDSLAVKMMNKYECLFDDITYVKEIKYLTPYTYLKLNKNGLKTIQIDIPLVNPTLHTDEILITLDNLFSKACEQIVQKNRLNHKKQVITISGGMDSRTTLLYGVKNGCSFNLSYCYSQGGSTDIEIAQKLSSRLGIPLLTYSMDNGWCLRDRENLIIKNDGMMCYSGTTKKARKPL